MESLEDVELGQAFDHHVPLEERAEEEGEKGRKEPGRYYAVSPEGRASAGSIREEAVEL